MPDPLIPVWPVAAPAAGVLVVANVLAIGPALVSARQLPSPLLHSE